jgi:prepilin-type N-terminal cleavage/methylation domain-containing protein
MQQIFTSPILNHPPRRAFSLVELSIVLVILGLLIGGILSGQSLIRAAELRSTTTQYQGYAAAVQTFRDKYFAAPGDMANADKFWGYLNGSSANCGPAVATVTSGTCNGDGNGIMNPAGAASISTEYYQFWRHMALAGLLEGSYTGTSGPGGFADSIIGTNVPAARISSGYWLIYSWPALVGNGSLFDGNYNNALTLYGATSGIMKPEEVWNIDTKIDDGKPGTGKLLVYFWATCTTASASDQNSTAAYLLSSSSIACGLTFPQML